MEERYEEDVVSRLLGECLKSRETAEQMFKTLIAGKECRLELGGETVELTEGERSEFVERFSAEVQPALWESKRLKN